MIQKDIYLKEERNKDIECEIEPCLHNVGVVCTLPVFLVSEPNFKALKWHGTHKLNSMEYVHHISLHIGVLIGPKHVVW